MQYALREYAKSVNKDVDSFTDDEQLAVINKIATLSALEMMNIMMQTQNVPELIDVAKKSKLHQDFDENVSDNHDKIDFERKWEHLRTKLGVPLSLDELIETESSLLAYESDFFDNATVQAEYAKLEEEFLLTLKN